jgi:hypothetical protein
LKGIRSKRQEPRAQGWDTLSNGELLTAAEEAGFDVLLTTDKNLRYQQNLTGRKIGEVRFELITGSRKQPLYWLVLVAKHEIAMKFWKKAAQHGKTQEMF